MIEPTTSAPHTSAALGVSEAECVAARVSSGEAVALRPEPAALLARVPALGTVTARSESDAASLECNGVYGPPDIGEHTGIVIGDNIDLRIFPSGWKFAYAVRDVAESTHSLRIFDAYGRASHAIVLGRDGDRAAFERLTAELAAPAAELPALARLRAPALVADADIDVAAYRTAYAAMTDTHDFFMLLRRFGLAREQGLRLADGAFARPLARDAHRELFARAAHDEIPLMLFIANEGIVQIASGPIPAPVYSGSRCELRGARFHLSLDEDGIARAWAVRKPTVNGIVTSLELYAAGGTLGLQVFGERHEGAGERSDWATAVERLAGATP